MACPRRYAIAARAGAAYVLSIRDNCTIDNQNREIDMLEVAADARKRRAGA